MKYGNPSPQGDEKNERNGKMDKNNGRRRDNLRTMRGGIDERSRKNKEEDRKKKI